MAPVIPIEFTGQRALKKLTEIEAAQMMGKKRKTSGGYFPGFVSDNRHAAETMAGSEWFDNSGRVDTEMRPSENSSAPKTKCISLTVDTCRFGVPFEMLSMSKMSKPERKNLERRLKFELEQVRILRNKINSLNSKAKLLPPSSDVHNHSRGHKPPGGEGSLPKGKKTAFSGTIRPRTKGAGAKHKESAKQSMCTGAPLASLFKQCDTLLNKLMSHHHGWVFNNPVDVVMLKLPDYFSIIEHPMDLGTVKQKLTSGKYETPLGFAADVRLTFSNATTYNPRGTDAYIMAEVLSKLFETRWKPIEKKLSGVLNESVALKSSVDQPVALKLSDAEVEAINQIHPAKNKKVASSDANIKQEFASRVMSNADKHRLSIELEALVAELPPCIVNFLKENSSNAEQTGEDEIEIDIEALSDEVLFMLRKLLDDYLLERQKKQSEAEPCETMLLDSGLTNFLAQPCKGNNIVNEDVDIGGNDPMLQIEKDAYWNSLYNNSSSPVGLLLDSSSSDSGSSGSETDGPIVSIHCDDMKEFVLSEECLEQKKSDVVDPDIENDAINGSSQVEHNSQSKTTSLPFGSNDCKEGESVLSERSVSPEKLYRAALLRSRFADTILKAQEKTLEGEKQDPKTLLIEREELEKRKREEKARLQAEAKAAEAARRKAEVEAAAEAKRRRELEREAARQALLKMEKTVDITNDSEFMEDLEMLTDTADDLPESLAQETSPDRLQNGFGSFKFRADSNPLEQLGLYMKMEDEEEEEEGESGGVQAAGNDDIRESA